MLAAQGLTNREIAERLVVSIRTVANTLYTVYERTGVTGREELAHVMAALADKPAPPISADRTLSSGEGGGR